MQLLYSSTVPIVEFASVSLLLRNEHMGESLVVASPLSTTSHAHDCLGELHEYLNSILGPNDVSTTHGQLNEDAKSMVLSLHPQVFRSSHCGLGLYYLFVNDLSTKSFSVLLGTNTRHTPSEVQGVVICAGASGLYYAQASAYLSLSRRLQEVVDVMRRMEGDPEECKLCYKALMSTLLLTDEEERVTNAMIESKQVTLNLESDQTEERQSGRFKSRRTSGIRRGISGGSEMKLTIGGSSSADKARMMEKQSALLSVFEKDCNLRRYEVSGQQRRSMFDFGGRIRRRKRVDEADLKDFDFYSQQKAKSTMSVTTETPSISLSGPQRDTALRPSKTAMPLPAPPRNPARRQITKSRQAAFDMFDQKDTGSGSDEALNRISFPGLDGVSNNNKNNKNISSNSSNSSANKNNSSLSSKHHDSVSTSTSNSGSLFAAFNGTQSFDPFSVEESSPGASNNTAGGRASMTPPTASSATMGASPGGFSPFQTSPTLSSPQAIEEEPVLVDESRQNWPTPLRPTDSNASRSRIQVNIALNEDLTCAYRHSRIHTCTIEGVIQVQVKAEDTTTTTPFSLLIRDAARHIRMIQENRRYADDMTESLSDQNVDDNGVDYKFTVTVPRAENYFPVMRYKCNPELRPVPIRVQTRVRISNGMCRVALQISSNPANEDDLTDLTIVMGVPTEVKGDTLTTSPPGGVWNAAKRSVVWCVAELGEGEKFQLQTQFELDVEQYNKSVAAAGSQDEQNSYKPKFPVLVRCQCMYAQLSDIEIEVTDIPDVAPTDIAMKLARRFRLSHRERS